MKNKKTIITISITLILIFIIIFIPSINKKSLNKVISIGEKNGYIYLINGKLEEKNIYKIANYYDSEYIIRNGILYIIYCSVNLNNKNNNTVITKYVDIINLKNNTKEKITIDEINNKKTKKDYIVYYYKNTKIYYKNLKTGKEYIDKNDKSNDNKIKISKTKYISKKDNEVYIKSNKRKKIIYKTNNKNKINNIQLINKNTIQISISAIKNSSYSIKEWKYYNFKKDTFIQRNKEGFNEILLLNNINVKYNKFIKNKKKTTNKNDNNEKNNIYLSEIENQNSINKKRIVKDLNYDITDDEIIDKVNLSIDDYNNYKNNFISNTDNFHYTNDSEKIEEYKKLAEQHFTVIKNFISKSDDKTTEQIYKYINKKTENLNPRDEILNIPLDNKYNLLYSRILSGILNYYIPSNNIKTIKRKDNTEEGNLSITLLVNSDYLIFYSFGYDYNLKIYKGVSSPNDIYNNYELYEDLDNTYLYLDITSYDILDYINNDIVPER